MFTENRTDEAHAALWFLGQAGFLLQSGEQKILIDPYLSDSVGKSDPRFTRTYPVPVNAAELDANLYLVTHDHLDHLDPETIARYPHKDRTVFVAPRFAARRLEELGVPRANIRVVDHGEKCEVNGVKIQGVFALATGRDVLDTTGYRVELPNGKSIYHTSDTAFCSLVLEDAPYADVLLVCINGKCGNLNVEQAVQLTEKVSPQFVVPMHHDVMALNAENPEAFRYFCAVRGLEDRCRILKPMEKLEW